MADAASLLCPGGRAEYSWIPLLPLVTGNGSLWSNRVDLAVERYEVAPSELRVSGDTVSETLCSDLFRSVCPVTGQPDYASIAIAYRGSRIERASLLRYIVSFRLHAGFHEHCVERIFVDLARHCGCEALTIHARFTRRGGLDINPFRTNACVPVPANVRTPRQ